ncbi:RsmB/NOP family class I SAM-dependent RNA methyltransferase [Halotia wernerae UHCC 0503]|nr:RsmB/NOP family class I SAM-dependent RNA methyltransferase [Halotia wernerae UHCC 0503]
MTPGGRIAAAIEILDLVHARKAPADRLASDYFRARRFIGSKDRTAISGLVYGVLRKRAQLEWWLARVREGAARVPFAPNGRSWLLAYLAIVETWEAGRIEHAFSGERYDPQPLQVHEQASIASLAGRSLDHPEQSDWVRFNLPPWAAERFTQRFGERARAEMAAMGTEAPLDLRVNVLKGKRDAARKALKEAGITTEATKMSPWGLRTEERANVMASAPYKAGLVEIQDEGSQLVALLVDAKPGMRVCDFCAGAGGKTLAIAATMENKGQIVACDTSEKRLAGATTRLRRAEVHNVERRLLESERDGWVKKHKGGFDRVLVDAPCTGTGTWRRNPDARWTLVRDEIAELTAKQARILESAARLVKPGGRLIYATCSVLPEENEAQAEAFLAAQSDFAPVPVAQVWEKAGEGTTLSLSPAKDGTDGFFVAVFERKEASPPA